MGTSKHTFDQVKQILGKLDRSIEAARARRLQGPAPLTAPVAPPRPGFAPQPAPAAPGGRVLAKPMRPTGPLGGPGPGFR
ncbi:MAG TPA: hypothetical protein VD963_10395 [Phycisphaerales bacterium]|nr:hypothetical protein [Phycisphaerales bacterium]